MEARLSAIINELPQRLSKEAHVAIDGMNEFERSNLRYTEYGRPVSGGERGESDAY